MVNLYRPDGSVWVPPSPVIPHPPYPPFDFQRGEIVGELGRNYVVVPSHKWADTPVLGHAMERAVQAFSTARMSPSQIEHIVQEYHSQDLLAIVVAGWGKASGKATWQWLYVPTVIEIKGPVKVALVLAGRWKAAHVHKPSSTSQ